jgi:hypothetical protein
VYTRIEDEEIFDMKGFWSLEQYYDAYMRSFYSTSRVVASGSTLEQLGKQSIALRSSFVMELVLLLLRPRHLRYYL